MFYINLFAQQDPIIKPGEMRIDFLPEFHLIANSPISGWYATNSNLDKVFVKDSSKKREYRFTNGEYLFFDWWFMPIKGLKLNLGYELVLDYADTFYQPVNLEHRLHNEYFEKFTKEDLERGIDLEKIKERIRLWKGKIEYRNNFIHSRFYKGYGHPGWHNDGDIFGFYPEQWDVKNYRRVGGEAAPFAFETDLNINLKGKNFGLLSVAAGPEPLWGNDFSYYAKYTYKYRFWVPTLLFKYEKIEWGLEDEKIWALALTTKYYGIRRIFIEGGVLFQPFRVNEEYTITHKTDPGKGYGESDYYIETRKTSYWDAFGFKIKGSTPLVPYLYKTTLTYTYLGKVAGNMHKIDLELEKKFKPYYSLYWQNIVRFPVEGPEVLILEGTEDTPGQPITQPRDRYDPFWVNSKNRKAYISTITFIYDPTPGSWIFKYYPNIIELWNLNYYETSPFALIINYKLSYYPDTTDLEPYKNSLNEWLWPGDYDITAVRGPSAPLTGCWALKRPIHFVTIVGEFKVLRNGLIICLAKAGEQLAQIPIAYTESTYELTPLTRMFDISITFFKYPYLSTFEYGHNVYGPEYWYQILGGVIDNMYKFSFKYNINKNNELEFQYIGFRETDNKYFLNKLGPFDEFRLSYKAKFGTRFSVYPSKSPYRERYRRKVYRKKRKKRKVKPKTVEEKKELEEEIDNLLEEE